MPRERKPLYYTFGNHMHWVDMQWLWGYGVLPGCVQDMLRLINETGARGNVNFDGIGYEKMAAECPEALASLRAAVAEGTVEPVGCSYGQPYGLFHGGESNVRQLTYGVRSVQRLLNVRPRSFWEEEFYFFPQLPQMLAGCAFDAACLFFQWTWHTPELPRERDPLILWEGIDGTRIAALPRNDLNVHQWPEDFDGLLESDLIRELPAPAVVQWLELTPTRDWMCRSELLLPRLKELMQDPRFEVRPRTVGQVVAEFRGSAAEIPIRRYGMDDVWHGMTLGKNGDAHPRASRETEGLIRAAESLSSLSGLFGRPYASWDVHPTWELEEAWRETLAAQHHDNHECEGLCGFVGHHQFARAQAAAQEVAGRAAWLLARRSGTDADQLVTNALGWERPEVRFTRGWNKPPTITRVPPFGYAAINTRLKRPAFVRVVRSKRAITLKRGKVACEIDRRDGAILCSGLRSEVRFGGFSMSRGGKPVRFGKPRITISRDGAGPAIVVSRSVPGGGEISTHVWIAPEADAIDVRVFGGWKGTLKPDAGLIAALQAGFECEPAPARILADAPYSIDVVRGSGECRRKYPSDDWMTSPQWFESVTDPFTSSSLVDMGNDDSGVLIVHDGSQQWFRRERGARVVLTAYDPWDEGRYTGSNFSAGFRIMPHRGLTHADRAGRAAEYNAAATPDRFNRDSQPVGGGTAGDRDKRDIPKQFGGVEVCDAPNVLAHAFFRESMKNGEGLPAWAGHRMFEDSGGACDHPYVIRLVEWDGRAGEVTLKLPGPVALAAKTNLLGEADANGWLTVEAADPPRWARGAKIKSKAIPWSQVRLSMRPREIATIYADLILGRKQWRDLDAKRRVWATVHKTEG